MTTGDKLHRVMQEKIAELGLDAAHEEAGPSREALMQVFRAATLWAYQFREGERAGDAATLLLLQLTRCESESGGSNG